VITWSLIRPNILIVKCWDDSAVVFNRQTGATHQVSLLAVELINHLKLTPSEKISGFLETLQDIFSDDDSEQESTDIIQNALNQLESISLIKRTPD
jgi:PqqD family protein of HPr-rel-A system